MQQSILFVNGAVKVKEHTLLTAEKITRLINSADFDEALDMLTEFGYNNHEGEYARLLKDIENENAVYLRAVHVKGFGLECFLLASDYQNAKVFVKSKYSVDPERGGTGMAPPSMLKSSGFILLKVLREGIVKGDYSGFSPEMRAALEQIDAEFKENRGRADRLSVILDKALYAEIFRRLKAQKDTEDLMGYFTAKVDFANIETYLRCKRFGLSADFYKECLVEGGNIDIGKLHGSYEKNLPGLTSLLRGTPYADFAVPPLAEDLTLFEVKRDNALLKLFRDKRADLFSAAPAAGYYLARQAEIKMIDAIITAKKNSIDKKELLKRLRNFYI